MWAQASLSVAPLALQQLTVICADLPRSEHTHKRKRRAFTLLFEPLLGVLSFALRRRSRPLASPSAFRLQSAYAQTLAVTRAPANTQVVLTLTPERNARRAASARHLLRNERRNETPGHMSP
jgi:hypothetical protein